LSTAPRYPASCCPLPAARFPLPASLCPLPASRCPLPAARFPLPAARCPLPAARFPLPSTPCHDMLRKCLKRPSWHVYVGFGHATACPILVLGGKGGAVIA
ncbi:hypothetical protein CLOP_g19237, partial [Closterium sp. NIES-67]